MPCGRAYRGPHPGRPAAIQVSQGPKLRVVRREPASTMYHALPSPPPTPRTAIATRLTNSLPNWGMGVRRPSGPGSQSGGRISARRSGVAVAGRGRSAGGLPGGVAGAVLAGTASCPLARRMVSASRFRASRVWSGMMPGLLLRRLGNLRLGQGRDRPASVPKAAAARPPGWDATAGLGSAE